MVDIEQVLIDLSESRSLRPYHVADTYHGGFFCLEGNAIAPEKLITDIAISI